MDVRPPASALGTSDGRSDGRSNGRSVADEDPSSPAWQKYYADASRRRRAMRKRHPKRLRRPQDIRRRRRYVELAFAACSVAFLGALTAIFHSLLSR